MFGQDWRGTMRISTSLVDTDIVLIEIEGDVDAYSARALDKALNHLLALGHRRLVLDASQMDFISSPGLRVILFAHREVSEHGGEVRAYGLTGQVRRIFEIAGLDELLQLSETRQEAMTGW